MLALLWYREDGSASALTRSLASAPDVMETLMPFLAAIMGESSLDRRAARAGAGDRGLGRPGDTGGARRD
jgi:hypothetical protein